jgi:hypothetical protein
MRTTFQTLLAFPPHGKIVPLTHEKFLVAQGNLKYRRHPVRAPLYHFRGSPNAAVCTIGGHGSTTGLVVPGGFGLTVIVLVADAQNATVAGYGGYAFGGIVLPTTISA